MKIGQTPKEVIRVNDEEARKMLGVIAGDERRPAGHMIAELVRAEYARRYSQPNPIIPVEEAQKGMERQS